MCYRKHDGLVLLSRQLDRAVHFNCLQSNMARWLVALALSGSIARAWQSQCEDFRLNNTGVEVIDATYHPVGSDLNFTSSGGSDLGSSPGAFCSESGLSPHTRYSMGQSGSRARARARARAQVRARGSGRLSISA
jgi:hypothetical protein